MTVPHVQPESGCSSSPPSQCFCPCDVISVFSDDIGVCRGFPSYRWSGRDLFQRSEVTEGVPHFFFFFLNVFSTSGAGLFFFLLNFLCVLRRDCWVFMTFDDADAFVCVFFFLRFSSDSTNSDSAKSKVRFKLAFH